LLFSHSYLTSILVFLLLFLSLRPLLFSFTDPSPTEIYTLSLHDALPILDIMLFLLLPLVFHQPDLSLQPHMSMQNLQDHRLNSQDRKSTRLNSSHVSISYAVFCLKKKTILYSLQLMVLILIEVSYFIQLP